MRDPCELAQGLLSVRRAFERGVSCGYVGHAWALRSHSQKGEGLPMSLWPQEEGWVCGTTLRSQSFLVVGPSEQRGGLCCRAWRRGRELDGAGTAPHGSRSSARLRLESGSFQFAFLSV